ncbi:hypothetical protein PN498_07935 [Oscillatoria sp. CS-180]|uniref:hypothetical protein n=1 Tax=Oscillatoria sp. CS-180 TaxID=3021720 RepID=UPI00232E923B|nr:hypothetical protein [Oscillatoria sp. CS-180]MDB9525911.1 hypothetical protein [Oscillatoria sp. CS-180]
MKGLATAAAEISFASPVWQTVRFRRAKEKKGWALLGIPSQVYPLVALRLFELQAKLISRHEAEGFTNLLFEAPPKVAAKLASAFPAPPGCDALKISESGDRILSGKAAKSAKAIAQRPDPSEFVEAI